MNFYQELEQKFESIEFQNKSKAFFKKYNDYDKIVSNQLQRFHDKLESNLINFDQIISKIQTKYESDEYWYKYMNQHIEPPKELYHFLYEYAQKFGRDCDENEYNKFGNRFTSNIYYIDGYYFHQMNGQGTVIIIIPEN
jgi:hypothetical protein